MSIGTINETECNGISELSTTGYTKTILHRSWIQGCPKIAETNPIMHNFREYHRDTFEWNSQVWMKCNYGYMFASTAEGKPGIDFNNSRCQLVSILKSTYALRTIIFFRQTLKCIYDDASQDFIWDNEMEPCEQILCKIPPPPPVNADMKSFSNTTGETKVNALDTVIQYQCPSSQLSSEEKYKYYAFDFPDQNDIKKIRLQCRKDSSWHILDGIMR